MSFNPAIESIATLLNPLTIPWGFCGGWAIDLFLNRVTRSHKDVDVAVLRTDQRLSLTSFVTEAGYWSKQRLESFIPFK